MLSDAAQFLLRTLFDLAACAFFLRFWMQWARVPFHNPFAQFVVKVTDFAVKPLRRILPGCSASTGPACCHFSWRNC
jgi:YggT family protein